MRHGIVADLCNVFNYGLFINAFKGRPGFSTASASLSFACSKYCPSAVVNAMGGVMFRQRPFLILPKLQLGVSRCAILLETI